MIHFKDIYKSFGSKKVLEEVDLKLEANQCHVLLGLSGSGKSTLLKLVMGLTSPTKGQVLIGGKEVSPTTSFDLRKGIGYVLQHSGLFPHLTAHENLELVAKVNKWSSPETLRRIHELTSLVDLEEDLLFKYPQQLSGGQRQRVGLIRALLVDPPLLLFDEALSALDPLTRRDLQKQLRNIFTKLNKTVLFVTHDVSEAIIVGDTLTLLNDGKIEQHNKVEAFISQPTSPFVSSFLKAQTPPSLLKGLL